MSKLIFRKNTRKIRVGNVYIGGDAPITVQSMTNTKTSDVRATVEQIKNLKKQVVILSGSQYQICSLPWQ